MIIAGMGQVNPDVNQLEENGQLTLCSRRHIKLTSNEPRRVPHEAKNRFNRPYSTFC